LFDCIFVDGGVEPGSPLEESPPPNQPITLGATVEFIQHATSECTFTR